MEILNCVKNNEAHGEFLVFKWKNLNSYNSLIFYHRNIFTVVISKTNFQFAEKYK